MPITVFSVHNNQVKLISLKLTCFLLFLMCLLKKSNKLTSHFRPSILNKSLSHSGTLQFKVCFCTSHCLWCWAYDKLRDNIMPRKSLEVWQKLYKNIYMNMWLIGIVQGNWYVLMTNGNINSLFGTSNVTNYTENEYLVYHCQSFNFH